MTIAMALIDQWTIWHVVIIAASIILALFSRKKYEVKEAEPAKA